LVPLASYRIFGDWSTSSDGGAIGQLVTHIVSLCAEKLRLPIWSGHPRQDVGRYFELMVLGVHTQVMLPAWVMGDSTKYWLVARIFSFAFGPLNRTLITPLVTSTLDT
jgi:hypothetical protein